METKDIILISRLEALESLLLDKKLVTRTELDKRFMQAFELNNIASKVKESAKEVGFFDEG